MEAVSFRGFPSTTLRYYGTWAVRLMAGHSSRRLNSVNPLDPHDTSGLERRLRRVSRHFADYGRRLTFRLTPLAPVDLEHLLDRLGFVAAGESLVMAAPLGRMDFQGVVDRVPLQDMGRWADSYLTLTGKLENRAGLVEIISSINVPVGMFLMEDGGAPVCALRCVCDGDHAGIFELATAVEYQRRGHARNMLASALKWALSHGAATAWLQVEADNRNAIGLYESFGFRTVYSYRYRLESE